MGIIGICERNCALGGKDLRKWGSSLFCTHYLMFPTAFVNFLYSRVVRPLLFSFDGETAHDITLKFLSSTQHTLLRTLYRQSRVDNPVELLGLTFPNRVGLAAGLDKNAQCIDAFDQMGFGFIEVGTVTPLAQAGNPKPRMFRIEQANALINRFGFNNLGLEVFLNNVKQAQLKNQIDPTKKTKNLRSPPMLIGLNVGKNALTPMEDARADYLIGLREVYPYADYVTINISSPNTKNLRSLQNDEALEQLLMSLEGERLKLAKIHTKNVPLFLKIAPDLDDSQIEVIANTLKRVSASGLSQNSSSPAAWGLIATNTTLSRSAVEGLRHADETGGLSGSPVFESSNRVIRQMRALLGPEFVIIGVGGIMSAKDALEKIKAGANLVQIYTGLIYKGPGLIQEIAYALKAKT